MKKSRSYLLPVLVGVLTLVFAVGLVACSGGKHTLKFDAGEGISIPDIVAKAGAEITPPADPEKEGFGFEGWYLDADCSGEKQTIPDVMPDKDITYYAKWAELSKITLSLDGGTIAGGGTLYLKAGADLYAFMQEHVPTKAGYEFGKWTFNGEDLKSGDVMPAEGATLSAVWKAPYTVRLYKLDFITYDDYIEDETALTGYGYAGETADGAEFVPEHYTLNTEMTNAVTVSESGDSELSVYVDPVFVRYTDVFEGTDYLYELEIEDSVLYLDRVGMEGGRKKSTSYDKATGAFSFETDDDGFTLEGVIEGDRFYYYRDTINRLFKDYLGSEATLEIVSPSEVTYTPATGAAVSGSYVIDAAAGKYLFMPETGDPMQFVLIESDGILYFRLHDGVEGWYAYGGELDGGGWSILGFDGFGVATSLDDDGVIVEYDYYAKGNGIVSIPDLGLIKVEDGTQGDLGGHVIKGTFSQSDGYAGEYIRVTGRRTDIFTLDGFGGATRSYHGEDGPTELISTGTYELVKDETWLIRSNSTVGNYGGVNKYMLYKATDIKGEHPSGDHFDDSTKTAKYLLSQSTDEDGGTMLAFDSLHNAMISCYVSEGVHEITSSFTFKGTSYTVDSTHKAFLYFYNHEFESSGRQEVDLWYGSYSVDYDADVYQLLIWGAWFLSSQNLYNGDLDYGDGMYFKTMKDDGSFEFDHEGWEGEVDKYVFYKGDDGSLEIDAIGEAYFYPTEGDPIKVTYRELATGLISVIKFTLPQGVPSTVHSLYAVYDTYYDIKAETEEVIIYDLEAEGAKYLTIAYADGSEGGDVVIVVTDDLTENIVFVGALFSDGASYTALEFLFAGSIVAVDDSSDEFTFTNNNDIYYEGLDYYDDGTLEEMFAEFRFKVTGNEFRYYDGYVFDLHSGDDTLATDGYGSATLTVGGQVTEGSYYMDYDVIIFTPAAQGAEDALYYVDEAEGTFTPVDLSTEDALIYGYYYGTTLDEKGMPDGVLSSGLHLNGKGGFIYENAALADDGYGLEVVTETGTYRIVSASMSAIGRLRASWTVMLTFDTEGAADVREAKVMVYDYYNDGDLYGFFIIQNKALMGQYDAYTDDGAVLGSLVGGDGYLEEDASFVGSDVNGPFGYTGYMARGTIVSDSYNVTPQFSEDKDGEVVVFVTYIGNTMMQYVFDIRSDGKAYYRDKFYGTVAEYKVQGGTTGNYLVLDGHNKATLYNSEDAQQSTGTYEFVPTLQDTYAYIVEGRTQFYFKPSAISYGGGVLYIYSVYGEGEDNDYFNDDWSILSMDGFGNAVYVDKYGVAYSGQYYKVIENEEIYCLKVTGSTRLIYFELNNNDGTFSVLQGEFLIRNNVLYVYFGADESIKIPDEVHTIATGAFKMSGANNIKSINFNNVTTIQDEAFYYATSLEQLVSDKIESIGASAFEHLWSLTKVDLPKCKTIGEKAFFDCVCLAEVKLGEIESIGKLAFTHATTVYETPFTLDLTAVDLSKLNVDLSAFLSKWFENPSSATIMIEGSKILVSGGIEGLNSAVAKFKGETSEIKYCDLSDNKTVKTGKVSVDLSEFIALALDQESAAVAGAYYDLKNDKVFVLEGGKATLYAKGDYGYEEESSYFYYAKGETGTMYAYKTGQFVSKGTFSVAGTSVTLDTDTLDKAGVSKEITFTLDEKELKLTYTANVSTADYISVSVQVTKVVYDGNEAGSIAYASSERSVTFNAANHSYKLLINGEDSTLQDLGEEIVLTDKTQSVWFRVTLMGSDGSYTLKKLEYNSCGAEYPDSFYSAYEGDYTEVDELTWKYEADDQIFNIKVTVAGDTPTLTVTFEGYNARVGYDYKVRLTVSDDKTQIVKIMGITDYYGDVVYTVSSFTLSEDNKTANVKTDNGDFVITIEPDEYSSVGFELTVIHTNYIYTEELYDDEYEYAVTVQFKVDAEGNETVTDVVKFVKNDLEEVVMEIEEMSIDAQGVITVKFTDGKTAKITIVQGYWTTLLIEWVEA